jgi:putative Mg2+ transporter-C (MgtC) family protein
MHHATASLWGGPGQGPRQVTELMLAFILGSAIGLERELRGKSAGLRTQTLVATAAALLILVSKYGFDDVLRNGHVVLDPSRVAAQIVSGVGFLGAGLILTRRGTVRGLTTAAAVWETAAVGMAAGGGLALIAIVVTCLHFVVVFGYTELLRRIRHGDVRHVRFVVRYRDGRGALRQVIGAATTAGWLVHDLQYEGGGAVDTAVQAQMVLTGTGEPTQLLARLSEVDGVVGVDALNDEG